MILKKQYSKRIKALGYSKAAWARHCGVDRKTIERHCSGRITPIKRVFWIALDALDGLGIPDDE